MVHTPENLVALLPHGLYTDDPTSPAPVMANRGSPENLAASLAGEFSGTLIGEFSDGGGGGQQRRRRIHHQSRERRQIRHREVAFNAHDRIEEA